MEEFRGRLERITFHNSDNGYVAAKVRPVDGKEGITVVVNLHYPLLEEELRFQATGLFTLDLVGNFNLLTVSKYYRHPPKKFFGFFIWSNSGRWTGDCRKTRREIWRANVGCTRKLPR